MNGKLAKAIRKANRKPGRADVAYHAREWRLGKQSPLRLTKDCDRYHHQRMKRAIQRGAGRG